MRDGRIFISYRRDDAAGYARSIYDRLDARFPKSIFMDVSRIEPGTDFVKAIEEAVGACDTLIVLMGKHWHGGRSPAEGRLDDPNDFVRLEIATALKRNIQVIPVLLRGAKPPGAQELPNDIAQLARLHALEITDEDFDHDIRRLVSYIKRIPDGGTRWRKVTLVGATALLLASLALAFWFFFRDETHRKTPPTYAHQVVTPSPASTISSTDVSLPDLAGFFKPDGGSASIAGQLMRQGPRPAASEKISGQPASVEVRAAIQKNYDQLHEGYAKKDLHAIKALYAPDFVARDGTIVMNAETSFSTKEMLFAMVSPTITFDIKDVIMTAPDTAVVTVKSEENVGFMHVTETARETWKHIGDRWLIKEAIVLDVR